MMKYDRDTARELDRCSFTLATSRWRQMYTSPISTKIKRQRLSFINSPLNIVSDGEKGQSEDTTADLGFENFQTPSKSSFTFGSLNPTTFLASSTPISVCDLDVATRLRNEVSLLQNKLSVLQVELDRVQKKHQHQVDNLEAKVVELTKQRRILLENECELKAKLEKQDNQTKQESKLAVMLESKSNELCKLEKLYQHSTDTITELQKQLKELQQSNHHQFSNSPRVLIDSDTDSGESSLREQLELLQNQLNKLTSDSRGVELQETARRLVELNSENAHLKSENDYFKKINRNRLLMEEKMHTFDQKLQELEDLKKSYTELSLKLAQPPPPVESSEGANQTSKLESTVKELREVTESQSSELSRARVNSDRLLAENAKLRQSCSSLEMSVEELKDQLCLFKKEHQMLLTERDNMKEQLKFN